MIIRYRSIRYQTVRWLVELTPAGDALFLRLRDAATAFDRQLRAGLSDSEIGQLETLLTRLRDNVAGQPAEN